jgi:hypothetical protein
MKIRILALCLLALVSPVDAQTCDVSELIRLERQRIGPEKPRAFPRIRPAEDQAVVEPCNMPEKLCAEKRANDKAAAETERDIKIRGIVLACERAGY